MLEVVVTRVLELYGELTLRTDLDWATVVRQQNCPFLGRDCIKTRKSHPDITIGTCSVLFGQKQPKEMIICPHRLLERRQIFTDCVHLLTNNEPGNELHLVPEVAIPGGNVDYFLVAVRKDKVRDFVGIEMQTLDSTGTVWPFRQQFLQSVGVAVSDLAQSADAEQATAMQEAEEEAAALAAAVLVDERSNRSQTGQRKKQGFGMNWKMTAKTILMQMHHKVRTFEHVNRHLVMVIQDHFFSYLQRQFNFGHMNQATLGDSMHIHVYSLESTAAAPLRLSLNSRYSTDEKGIAQALGQQAEAKVELDQINALLEAKLSRDTVLMLV